MLVVVAPVYSHKANIKTQKVYAVITSIMVTLSHHYLQLNLYAWPIKHFIVAL